MQFVVVVPEFATVADCYTDAKVLMRPVCGVPLLLRTLATAVRAGADDVLLVWPENAPTELADIYMQPPLLRGPGTVRLLRVKNFDPRARSSWVSVLDGFDTQFMWLPWNWVTNKQSLVRLPLVGMDSVDWSRPAFVTTNEVTRGEISTALPHRNVEGIAVISPETAAAAEQFLVVHSGKVLDGIHTSFNRRLCRPFVKWLSHTGITPNAVTFGGVAVSILSAIAFAGGFYWAYVAGALLFYIAGLFDEMDGMLARIKFAGSPFGTWLEGFADGLSYLLLFGGITVGLYRQYGSFELWIGAVLLTGTLLSVIITSLQRKRATTPDRPNEYLGRFYRLLENDSSNWISKMVRHLQAFQKRGVLIIYVVLFTLLGELPVLFYLSTLGSHLIWTLALYFNHRFFKQPATGMAGIKAV